MAATISANSAGGGGLVTTGDASGVLALQTAGVTGLTIDASQKVTFANSLTSPTLVTPVINGMASSILTSGTAVASTSGTSIDFTGIPSWAKRITVMFNGVSTSGTSAVQMQLGTSTSVETTGYVGSVATILGGTANAAFSAGFLISSGAGDLATSVRYGALIISKIDTNTYTGIGNFSYGSTDTRFFVLAGNKTTGSTLDRVRITTVNGTDTFDAGSINIMYE
jgi:hypothetical protein